MNKKRDDKEVETGGATERGGGGGCQIRSQHKRSSLIIFSPKPPSLPASFIQVSAANSEDLKFVGTLVDVTVAIFWALTLSMLVISSYKALYFRHFWLLFLIICLAIFLPVHLRSSRAQNRERRLVLPLST
ncbi:hypothetical protein NC652_018640 [Populus alba x Populus x berolinensis]|nr:hypothetical protein NC652_018640 [Populus alba x Populus x berolinensis]